MSEHIKVVADKCRACRRCEIACIAAHHGLSFKEAMKHRDELVARVQVVKNEEFKTTVRCHQCPHAPCANVCPTGALQQDAEGRIIMRVQFCAACKMCMAVCPYGTITMETIGMPTTEAGAERETLAQRARREVAVRCDLCTAWRMQNGKRIPACVEACPAQAISFVLSDGTELEAPKPEKKQPAASTAKNGAAKVNPVAEAVTPEGAATAPASESGASKAAEKAQETPPPAPKAPSLPVERNVQPPSQRVAQPPVEKPTQLPVEKQVQTPAVTTPAQAPAKVTETDKPKPQQAPQQKTGDAAPAPMKAAPAKVATQKKAAKKKPGKGGKKSG